MTWLDFILYRKLGSWRLELNPVNSFTISHLLWGTILTPGFLESGSLLQAITYAKLHGCWLLSRYFFLMQKQCQFIVTSWSWNCHWTCSLKCFLYGINEPGSWTNHNWKKNAICAFFCSVSKLKENIRFLSEKERWPNEVAACEICEFLFVLPVLPQLSLHFLCGSHWYQKSFLSQGLCH